MTADAPADPPRPVPAGALDAALNALQAWVDRNPATEPADPVTIVLAHHEAVRRMFEDPPEDEYPGLAPLRCLVCGKNAELMWAGARDCPDGTIFTARGNYGSGLWDVMGERVHLETVVCDLCLRGAGNAGRVFRVERRMPSHNPPPRRTIWTPPAPEANYHDE